MTNQLLMEVFLRPMIGVNVFQTSIVLFFWQLIGGALVIVLLITQIRSAVRSYKTTHTFRSMIDEVVKTLAGFVLISIIFFGGDLMGSINYIKNIVLALYDNYIKPFFQSLGIPL